LADDDAIRICGRAAGTEKDFPAHASAFDYPALDLSYSNPADCSKTAPRTARPTGFDVVFEHQITQVKVGCAPDSR
jgi:hypothetical protein